MKKVSQAALDGLAKVSRQGCGTMYRRDEDCACFEGCVAIGYGVPKNSLNGYHVTNRLRGHKRKALEAADAALVAAVGLSGMGLNDNEGLSVEDIAGILRAEGH